MSVINNVLKDLESRESRFTPIEIDPIGRQPAAARDLKPVLLALLLFLLLAAAAWIYLQGQHFANPGSASLSPASSAIVAAVAPATKPEVTPGVVTDQMIGNQIIGLQIRESEDDMRIEFALRDKVVAYLKQRGENSFGYHLRDVESQILAPVISNNRWIERLTINPSDTGVDINFQTAEDILVETRQNLVDGETIWIINLRKFAAVDTASENVVADKPALREPRPGAGLPLVVASVDPAATDLKSEPTPVTALSGGVVKIDIESTNPNAKVANQLEYAVELINSRRVAKAQALLQELLNGNEDYNVRQHLLALYSRQNQSARFLRLARESMLKYPDDTLFKTEYARSLFQASSYRSVIQLFADEVPIDADQQALLAASYQRLDEHESAVRYYQLALAQDVANAKNWIALGISQEHTAALEDALNSYQQATKLGNLNNRLRAFVDKRSRTLRQVLN